MLLVIKHNAIIEMSKCENTGILESVKYVLASRAQIYQDLLYNKPCINTRSLWRAAEKKHGLSFGGSSQLVHVKMVHKVRIVCKVNGLLSLLLPIFIFLSGALTQGRGRGEAGVENEQRNSFSVGSGYASCVGWGVSAFLPSNVWWIHNIPTEHPGAT